ncbi:headcase protein homolog isoform X2 [Sarcophilus harrisii]|uniref:Hdc homolog, cell cycle regulator n=1 Tax=Sarcophilus harrisii TaxID=9305 RepID=A0A7N4NG83_SARHA|nr:headcase protein homolog isoform X2 [Sarcophilus harrisii]
MPNPKSSKGGRKNKRANSSGDEQENGAGALAAAAAAGAAGGGALAAAAGSGAAAGAGAAGAGAGAPGAGGAAPGAGSAAGAGAAAAAAAAASNDAKSEAPCATPLICSFGRPVDLDKDDYQKVVCNNEHCPYSTWMHLQCFYEWESSILVQFNCIGRARSWNEKQCRQNMWTKKGYDLAFRFCSCRCGQGHLKKDTDWYQVKRMQDEKKKKSMSEKSTGRPMTETGEEIKKCRPLNKAQKGLSHDLPRRHSMDRQNSQEKGVNAGGYGVRSPCGSPGQSPPTGYSILSPAHFSGPRSSRYLGEFLKNAIHLEPHKKNMTGGSMFRNAHFDYGATGLPAHRGGHFDAPVQFLRRLDLSELLAHIPRHKLNTFHVRMEDDAQVGQGEDLRKFILAALSASHRNVVNCALCHRALPVFEQFPLVDGTLFLSPSRHDEIEYDVPCHLQGRLMHLYAVCVDCLEGVHKIICIKCKSRWDGSWHQLGTMYTYDILAASPCCQFLLFVEVGGI